MNSGKIDAINLVIKMLEFETGIEDRDKLKDSFTEHEREWVAKYCGYRLCGMTEYTNDLKAIFGNAGVPLPPPIEKPSKSKKLEKNIILTNILKRAQRETDALGLKGKIVYIDTVNKEGG